MRRFIYLTNTLNNYFFIVFYKNIKGDIFIIIPLIILTFLLFDFYKGITDKQGYSFKK